MQARVFIQYANGALQLCRTTDKFNGKHVDLVNTIAGTRRVRKSWMKR
ncbi:hypothetical protein [Hymenobacter busanensis]|nr:hypothetical protein [Hymenobacter busanensis]QHJ06380.1 hypothetical protein GUY19_03325 [Hymenobacter busanensis]